MATAGGDAAVFRCAGVSADRRAPDRAQAFTRHHRIAHRFPADRKSHHSRRFHRRRLAGPADGGAGDGPAGAIAGRFRYRSRQYFRTLYRHPGDSRGDCPRRRCSKNQRADGVLHLERRRCGGRSCRSGHSRRRPRRAVPAADRRSRGAAVVEGHTAEAPARRRCSASCGASGRAAAHPGRPHRSSSAPQDRGDRRHGGMDGKHESRRSPLLQAGVRGSGNGSMRWSASKARWSIRSPES